VIGGFYIGEHYCILHALGNKKDNLAVFNLADFCNLPKCQNKFYTKFSSYMVCTILLASVGFAQACPNYPVVLL